MNSSSRPARLPWIFLGLILIVAGSLRIARSGYDSLTFDEQWHVELSTGRGSPHVRLPDDMLIPSAPAVTSLVDAPPWWKVWTNMDFVVHPPLYCTLLRIWREIFGAGDVSARVFSIGCALIAIALLFDAVRLLNGPVAASWACLILAVAPTQVMLGQQVRGYMLLEALAMAACSAAVRLEKLGFNSRRAIALGACTLGMMLTHYLAIGACAALFVYLCIRTRGTTRRSALVACVVAAIVYAIIWGPFFWQQRMNFRGTADPWLVERGADHLALTLHRAFSAPWSQLTEAGLPLFAWITFLTLIAAWARLYWQRDLLLWFLWLAGTVGLLLVLDLSRSTRHLAFVRYGSLAAPAIAALIATVTSHARGVLKSLLPAATVVACAALSSSAYVSEEPDWRDLGRMIDQKSPAGETIVFYSGAQPFWYREIFYLGASHYSHAFPRPIVKLSRPADAQLIESLSGNSVMLVSGQIGDPREVLPGCQIIEQTILPNLAICTRLRLPNH